MRRRNNGRWNDQWRKYAPSREKKETGKIKKANKKKRNRRKKDKETQGQKKIKSGRKSSSKLLLIYF